MLEFRSGNAAAVLIVHEIYGVNRHMETAAGELSRAGYDVFCPNLLGRPAYDYAEEAAAYRHFGEQVGFERAQAAVDAVAEKLRPAYRRLYLVGYSAGATVAWLASRTGLYAGVAGYYGSRIRDYRDVRPACPVLLLFPRREASFDVAGLAAGLAAGNGIEVHSFGGDHGFADPCGPRYQPQAAAAAFARLTAFLANSATGRR